VPTSTAAELSSWGLLLGTGEGPDGSFALARLGGKGAQTAKLQALGLPIPPTAVVTVPAYRAVAEAAVVATVIDRIRAGEIVPAEAVDAAFLEAPLPQPIADSILCLGAAVAGEGGLAVRSSATVEDLEGTSFAGQYSSFLDVRPGADLLRAVRLVWASLWHPAPCAYRRANGVDEGGAGMAVVLMAMIPAVQAGVVFTVDPAGPAGHIRVEAVDGLGESLVSGAVTPRFWSLPREHAAEEGEPIGSASALALAAENGFGLPLDVEWAWDGTRTWLVQARPITADAPAADGFDTPVDDHELTTAGIAEMLPGVLPPLIWQLAGTAVEEAMRTAFDGLGSLDPTLVAPHGLIRRVRGRAALDLDALTAVGAALPGGSAEAVEHGFFGRGDVPPPAARAAPWRRARHDLRVERARRRSLQDARVCVLAAAQLAADAPPVGELDHESLLGWRRRLIDLGLRAMTAEVGVAAAATAAYDRLETFLASHLPADEASRRARGLTTGIAGGSATPSASMSVFAGPTWEEAGVVPPAARPADDRRDDALTEVERVLSALPRWRATRIMTGQVIDVRLHLLRRLTAEAVSLLGWREQAKVAVLSVGGQVRAAHRVLGDRWTAAGLLRDPLDVDLLADAELRGDAAMPSLAVLARRRRALDRSAGEASLPERFKGVPADERPPMPSGDRLVGLAASAGRCTARARVVRDPRTAKLRAGEVLVAESTDAGWSPLFVEAGAIVVERGGPLSHAAIVARELGVPAVLDVHGATAGLDGRIVTVDGDAGIVVIHGEVASR
jgi:phosphohistidine swiveling domain-containing protein